MKTYILKHNHRHGEEIYLFNSDEDPIGYWNQDCEVIKEQDEALMLGILKALGIDFEQDRGETIEIEEFPIKGIPTIKDGQKTEAAPEDPIQQARETLEAAGYFVRNLWSAEDVTGKYKCDNDTALGILDQALGSERIMGEIWGTIEYYAQEEGLEEVEEED